MNSPVYGRSTNNGKSYCLLNVMKPLIKIGRALAIRPWSVTLLRAAIASATVGVATIAVSQVTFECHLSQLQQFCFVAAEGASVRRLQETVQSRPTFSSALVPWADDPTRTTLVIQQRRTPAVELRPALRV